MTAASRHDEDTAPGARRPSLAEALGQAVALHQAGQWDKAERLYRAILAAQPGHPAAGQCLCLLSLQAGAPERALPVFRTTLSGLLGSGREAEAENLARRLVAALPGEVLGWQALGAALARQRQGEKAARALNRALRLAPDDPDTLGGLGRLLQELGRPDEAVARLTRLLELAPDNAEAHNNLGAALRDLGRLDEAMVHFAQALEHRPDLAAAHGNLGAVFLDLGRLDEAVERFGRALALAPDLATVHTNCGNALQKLGRTDEAVARHERALALRPGDAAAHGNLLFTLAHDARTTPEAYLERARAWERTALTEDERQAAAATVFAPRPRAGRRLRVGYVSGDFRRHAVSSFLPDIFAGHDRKRFEVFAYATSHATDGVTLRLQGLADRWTRLAGLPDEAATAAIRRDGIDVLIDLSGHTRHNRLGVFARRAAPVQAHYLGYFASTGLSAMDYCIADASVIPEAEDGWYAETVWRLPRTRLCYHGDEDAPDPAWRPDPDGLVWFGGCNTHDKITPQAVALWSRLLDRCPEGRLALKAAAFASPAIRDRMLAAFAGQGIDPRRILLAGWTPGWREHMAFYDRLDVALDPVGGHCGVTTTCEALWMGVPVVTLAGQGMVRRMCASILDTVGRPDWIAGDEEAYLDTALRLAGEVAARQALRRTLRETMANSPLGDGPGLVRALEAAYEAMFDRWAGDTAGQADR